MPAGAAFDGPGFMIQLFLIRAISLPVFVLVLDSLIRVIRDFFKFTMPQWMVNAIDSPLRRRIQHPDAIAVRHGIGPWMTVCEVGEGNGCYSIAAAQRLAESSRLLISDIEPKMHSRVKERITQDGESNTAGMVANVYRLPFQDE